MVQKLAIRVEVNGKPCVADVEPRLLLGDYLREHLGLTGTHLACEEGACGACSVLLDGKPTLACTMLAVQADGARVTTVEGLAPEGTLTALQDAFRRRGGLQCGYCTPGFLVAATALLAENPTPSREEVIEALAGNLCRCTGYNSIVDAVLDAAGSHETQQQKDATESRGSSVDARAGPVPSNGHRSTAPLARVGQVDSLPLSGTMRAMLFTGPGARLVAGTAPIPALGPTDVLVRVRAGGLCHTELHFLDGILPAAHLPMIPGHEVAGEVAAHGERVQGLAPGQRVVVNYYATCGQCRWCRTGRENLCANVEAQLGFSADGGYAEYVKVPSRTLVPLPMEISFEDGATLACSATTALHATRTIAGVRLGDTVLVYGAGGVGLAIVQMCKVAGARVLVVDRVQEKLRLARGLGADEVIDGRSEDVPAAVQRLTGGEGVDAVFELVGVTATMQNSLQALGKRGKLVFIGYSRDALTVSPVQMVIGEQQVLTSVGNTRQELVEVVELARTGRIKAVVSDVCALEGVNEVLDRLAHGQILGRAVFRP